MDLIALVELSFEIWDADQDSEIIPDISRSKPQRFSHESRSANARSGGLSALDTQDSLTLEAVKVLGEASAVGLEVVPLHGQHKERITLIKGVKNTKKVSGMAVCGKGEEVS